MSSLSQNSDVLVDISDLHFGWTPARSIFSGVDVSIQRGKITAIMGPSGTGKTTLLKLIAAQLKPQQGQILVDGQNVNALSRS